MSDESLRNVKTLQQALERTPNGVDAVALATKLGIWTAESHKATPQRKAFPSNVAALGPNELSDLMAYWTSEFGRINELAGVLVGQRELLKLKGKAARAAARSRLRREKSNEKLSSTALNDAAEEDAAVLEADERLQVVEVLLAQIQAAKEATQQYIASASREISYRDAQMKARMY